MLIILLAFPSEKFRKCVDGIVCKPSFLSKCVPIDEPRFKGAQQGGTKRACLYVCERDEAETGELEPVSLGRGPGECSVDCDLVGTSFPSYAQCHPIEEM